MNAGAEPNWDGDLFRFYNKRLNAESWQAESWQADSWQSAFVDGSPETGPAGWPAESGGDGVGGNGYGTDSYGRALFGGPGADLFSSGTSSRDAGETPEEQERRSGPASGSMPPISQPMTPISQSMPSISGSMPSISNQSGPERDEMSEPGSLVRPYARTRGRTRTDYDLAIETLVSTSERGRTQSSPSTPEHRSICGLCEEARSVAEISAHLRLPLGVVRVLIGDMAGLGLVLIHDSGMAVGDRPSMDFLERVLSGLRKL